MILVYYLDLPEGSTYNTTEPPSSSLKEGRSASRAEQLVGKYMHLYIC